ncbi:MAG: tetratricopeptide repeat protein [Planctomycetales bacterium]|nr:tetratricopeptide repeat protein [Planctomycetales bacterium]
MALVDPERRIGPDVFLTDFGLAKLATTGSRITRTGQALGTPAYMSPEQARGEVSTLTPATDVWSLGCVLHEVLAGRPPFEGDTPAAVLARVLLGSPPGVGRRTPGIPGSLESLILACLSKDARRRPVEGASLRDDLDRVLRGEKPLARPRRSRIPTAAGIALLGAGAALAALSVLAGGAPGPEAPAAAAAPSGPDARAARAWALRLADVGRARALMREALLESPARHDWRLQAGLLEWAARHDEEAARLWSEVPAGAPERTRALWLRGLAALTRDLEAPGDEHLGEARDAWTEASRGAAVEARWARAGLCVLGGRVEEGRAILDGETSWESGLLLAVLEAGAHAKGWSWRPEVAVRCCTRAITEGIPMPWLLAFRGDVHRLREDLPAALVDYDAALAMDPGLRQALANRGGVRFRTGDLRGALEDFDAVLAREPSNPRFLLNRGAVRRALGDLAGALADDDAAVALDPRNPHATFVRAVTRERLGDGSGAIADYDATLVLQPDHKGALCNRGALRMRGGDVAGALADYDAVLLLDPNDRESRFNRGNARRARGDLRGAIADYDAALSVDPRMKEALVNRGTARRSLGDLAGARADFDAVISMDPRHPGAHANRGLVRSGEGDRAGAAADFQKALDLAPADWPPRARFERLLREAQAAAGPR